MGSPLSDFILVGSSISKNKIGKVRKKSEIQNEGRHYNSFGHVSGLYGPHCSRPEKQRKKRQIIMGITVVVMGLVTAMAADTNPVMEGDINPGTADLDLITPEAMAD